MAVRPEDARPQTGAPGSTPRATDSVATPRSTLLLPSTLAAEPGPVSTPAELPKQFGRYHISKQLGRGGMGSVYLAHDSQLDRQVALKVPILEPGDGGEVLQRFQREARAAATIEHPNICPIYDVGTLTGIPYVTMAFIEGRPLSELLRAEKRLPQRPVAAVARKLALAMQAAHSRGVIHRDLKPANVMINKRNEPVVMDFGLARRANQDVRLTVEGAILGTPAYMSPEQARGAESGVASDIYSLGVILYEMLTGRLPFRGDVQSVLMQIISQPPDPPSAHNPEVEPALAAICLKAMAKSPQDRFASMQDFAAALGDYLKGSKGVVELAPPGLSPGSPQPPPVGSGAALSGEGVATQLLARLAERLDSPPPAKTAPAPQANRAQWIAVLTGALTLVALIFVGAAIMNQKPVSVSTTVEVRLPDLVPELRNPIYVVFVLDGQTLTREQVDRMMPVTHGEHILELREKDGTAITRRFAITAKTQPDPDQNPNVADGEGGNGETDGPKNGRGSPALEKPAAGFDRAEWVDRVTWDAKIFEDKFRVLGRTYDEQNEQVEWLLEAKGRTSFGSSTPYRAKFYDEENVAGEPVPLRMKPFNVENVGDRVRATLQLQRPGPGRSRSEDPLNKIVKVVLSEFGGTRGGGPGSGP